MKQRKHSRFLFAAPILLTSLLLSCGTSSSTVSSSDSSTSSLPPSEGSSSSSSSSTDTSRVEILNGDECVLYQEDELTLEVEVENSSSPIYFLSSDPSVATVSEVGTIHALKPGTTLVTARSGTAQDQILVRVQEGLRPEIVLSAERVEMDPRTTTTLSYRVTNDGGDLSARSSDESVVTADVISASALELTAHLPGEAEITLSLESGVTKTILVIVKEESVQSLSISVDFDEIAVSEKGEVHIDILPAYREEDVELCILSGSDCLTLDGTSFLAVKAGEVRLQAFVDDYSSNVLVLSIYDFDAVLTKNPLFVGEVAEVVLSYYEGTPQELSWQIEDEEVFSLRRQDGRLFLEALRVGSSTLTLFDAHGHRATPILVEVIGGNPYEDVDPSDFYRDYSPARNARDAENRSDCFLMSGDLQVPDQEPEVASDQPTRDGLLIHNTTSLYSEDGDTYSVLDADGEVAFEVYRGGAYVTLEEVAAYVYAFGDVPPNYDADTDLEPYQSPWEEYLRVNNNFFSGKVSDYPYEPELPGISGCGGNLAYYEIDIGTTGTDCDPSFPDRIYNNGSRITRGAARIVYSSYYIDTGEPVRSEDRYVFYTYNHYNDFQEYLNYENGWGEMFGNVTGGGVLSSMNPALCHPTPYVETIRSPF